jgi:uncharacterized protein (DUF1800 family)
VTERERTAWLLRRAAFGGGGADLDQPSGALLDRLVDPDAHGVAPTPDTWDVAVLTAGDRGEAARTARRHAIDGWLERLRVTPRPLEARMAWVWHDHFATSIAKVRSAAFMVGHVQTLERLGLGSFRELVRAMTVDAAMLLWLDGDSSTAAAPNENYGRELLELFTVGLDAYTEADVHAAAHALTGWRVAPRRGIVAFVAGQHDDTPQVLQDTDGVHDVDTVVDAVCAAPACPPFVTRALADKLLGPAAAADDDLVGDLAADFRTGGLELRPLVRALLDAGLDRDDTEVVEAPVPWLVRAERLVGVRLPPPARLAGLAACGQVPMLPPDVGGWPVHTTWLASGTVLGRASLAAYLAAAAAPGSAPRVAARRRDLDALAAALGRPAGFTDATAAAIRSAVDEVAALAVALAAPEQVVV